MKIHPLLGGLIAAPTLALTLCADTIDLATYDPDCYERWPDPALLVVRRTGGTAPLTVNVSFSGTATRSTDYTPSIAGNTVDFAKNQNEVVIEILPIADSVNSEPEETVKLQVKAGSGYTIGSKSTATATIIHQGNASGPSPEEAARFLIQAAFGPDQDLPNDDDFIPENVEAVMKLGFEGWIDDQFKRPVGKLQPFVKWALSQPDSAQIYNDTKQDAWWGRAMGLPKLRPDATDTQEADPLRQRLGFSLSQIFVISDRMEDIGVAPEGMANYYDMLLSNSFGNYRDLMFDVTVHPCMGMFLSHLCNRKPDPVANIFPDENYAREIMQLFSIGLWMLNPDGSRALDENGNGTPTYSNTDITNFARVFTGLAFGGTNTLFGLYPRDFTVPMKAWDEEHDLDPKTLLLGKKTPKRTASPGNKGTATFADVNAAVDNLFNHPNVGPFIGKQLIQRFTTSNPSPEYISRVAAAFNNNGKGVRGDMKAVIKAILLDPEARSSDALSSKTFGKLREPFLKCVNVARAFNAKSKEGWYYLSNFGLDIAQEPLKSPGVFNYYLPSYSPPGAMAKKGLVGPEFQIVNASTGVKAANYFFQAITGGLNPQGTAQAKRQVSLNLDQENLLNVPAKAIGDPDATAQPFAPEPLLQRLDLVLTAGTLSNRNFQIISEAMRQIGPGSGYDWPTRRLNLAIYLIVNSPEFSVLR